MPRNDGGFDTDPSEDVWFEASSLPIPNERPDLPPDNALRIRVTDVLTEYGFTDIDVKAPDRTPEGIWIGFEAMQPVRLDVTSAQEGRSVSFTLTAAEANDWRSGRLDAHGLSRMAVERVLARPGDTVTLADEMRRFLPAGLMTSTVESPRWSAWAIEQIGTLYGTPGTPSSADAVPGFPIFGASNDSSPTR